jgi:hypothetical protein
LGASIVAYWPGITEDQLDEQPGFWNDDRAWGNWMAERESEPDVMQTIAQLGADALLTVSTDGVDDSDVMWVTPKQLGVAARTLLDAVKEGRPDIDRVLEVYARNANGVEPIDEEFMRDLLDIEQIAHWAELEGADKMTLMVNW